MCLCCTQIDRKVPYNLISSGLPQHLGPHSLANLWPWEIHVVTATASVGGGISQVGSQTRREPRCNLISRFISSTKGGNYTAKGKAWDSAGTFVNFQMVRTIIMMVVFQNNIQVQRCCTSVPSIGNTLCGKCHLRNKGQPSNQLALNSRKQSLELCLNTGFCDCFPQVTVQL